jgi:hypothetical protein
VYGIAPGIATPFRGKARTAFLVAMGAVVAYGAP